MKAVIVEDEYVAAKSLERLIDKVDDSISIITVLQSVEESVEWFSTNPPPRCGIHGYPPCRWRFLCHF
jgi:two-component system response regulator LytT